MISCIQCQQKVGMEKEQIRYQVKLCTESESNQQQHAEMYLTRYDNKDPQPKQDLYISGNYADVGEMAEGSPLTFDQTFLKKLKTALKNFERCFQRNEQKCQIDGLNLDVKPEKKLSIVLKETSDGGLEVSNIRIESLFSRKRRSIIPDDCKDPTKFKCWGKTFVTAKPQMKRRRARRARRDTFVHIQFNKGSRKTAPASSPPATASSTRIQPSKTSPNQQTTQRFVVHFDNSISRMRRSIVWFTVQNKQRQFPKSLMVFEESIDALASF